MADSRQDRERQEALDAEQAKLSEEKIKSLRKLSDQFDVAAQQAKESNKINLELAEMAKMEGDDIAARDLRASAIADAMKANTLVLQAGKEDAKAERLDKKRLNAAAKGDEREKAEEEKARLAKLSSKDKLTEGAKGISGPIKTPSFLMKLAKLALGIVGVKVFSVMINNFDSIKKFVKEKILPATEGIFTFFKETVFPFISDNFKEIMNGFVLLSGVFLAGFVFIKIINAVKIVRAGLLALQLGMIATGKGLSSMVTGVLSKLGTAVKFLRAGYLAITAFTMTTLVPALMTAVAAMSIAIAPFLPIIIGVGLAFAGVVLLLNMLKESLGFDSVFDVMFLGLAHLQDAFGHIVNSISQVVNFIMDIVGKVAKLIGFDVVMPKIPYMSTDNAKEFTKEVKIRQEKEKAEKLSKGEVGTSEIPELPVAQKVSQSEIPELTVKVSKISTEEKESQLSAIPTKPMERSGRSGRKLEALSTGRNDVENMSVSGGGNLAVQNISAPTTTNNSQSSAVYGDASPATDDLDRVAFG